MAISAYSDRGFDNLADNTVDLDCQNCAETYQGSENGKQIQEIPSPDEG
ncbi:MAG: hypothetical protein WC107_05465 [Patescibacteria group bacterium]